MRGGRGRGAHTPTNPKFTDTQRMAWPFTSITIWAYTKKTGARHIVHLIVIAVAERAVTPGERFAHLQRLLCTQAIRAIFRSTLAKNMSYIVRGRELEIGDCAGSDWQGPKGGSATPDSTLLKSVLLVWCTFHSHQSARCYAVLGQLTSVAATFYWLKPAARRLRERRRLSLALSWGNR